MTGTVINTTVQGGTTVSMTAAGGIVISMTPTPAITLVFTVGQGTAGTGNMFGPASATDNAIARFDGTTGKVIQNSGITIADGAVGTLSGTNTGDVTLAGQSYLSIAGQVITANQVNLSGSHVTGILPNAKTTATAANTASAIVARDASGNFAAGTITAALTGNVTGNASTATALATGRTLGITGDLTWTSPAFDGTGNVTAVGTLANTGVVAGSYTAANITVDSKGRITAAANGGGAGTGTVTSVSVTTANGVSGTVATATTTPAITLTLGNITPTSVAATGNVTGANLSGTNTGDQTITLTGDVTGSGTGSFAATLANTAVTPGSYTSANITVDAKGRITAAASGGGGSGDMTKAVYDSQNLGVITGLNGASGGIGGSLNMQGGSGANAHAGVIIISGGSGSSVFGGSITTQGLASAGGSIDTRGSSDATSPGGSITTSGGGGSSAGGGLINTSGGLTAAANGGSIQTYGDTLPGGSIDTHSGGGSINTRGTGSIGMGVAGTRTTLNGQAASDITVLLPAAAGTLLVANATADGTYAVFNDGVTSGQLTSLTFVNGLLTSASVIP